MDTIPNAEDNAENYKEFCEFVSLPSSTLLPLNFTIPHAFLLDCLQTEIICPLNAYVRKIKGDQIRKKDCVVVIEINEQIKHLVLNTLNISLDLNQNSNNQFQGLSSKYNKIVNMEDKQFLAAIKKSQLPQSKLNGYEALAASAIFRGKYIVNYTQIWAQLIQRGMTEEDLLNSYDLPSPSAFNTGDVIQTHNYRGCGTYYAIFLSKNIHSNELLSEEEIESFIKAGEEDPVRKFSLGKRKREKTKEEKEAK